AMGLLVPALEAVPGPLPVGVVFKMGQLKVKWATGSSGGIDTGSDRLLVPTFTISKFVLYGPRVPCGLTTVCPAAVPLAKYFAIALKTKSRFKFPLGPVELIWPPGNAVSVGSISKVSVVLL